MKSKNNKIIALFLFILLTILLTGMVYATTEDNTGETSGITGWSDVSEQVNIDQQDTVINAEKNTIITDDNNNGGQDSKAKTIDKNTDTTASKTVPANVTYSGEDTDSYDKVMELIERNDDAQELIIELNTDKVYVITDSILYMVHHNTKTVTVIGNGAVLDAMGKESFIVVDKGYTLNLKNLTVRNTYGRMGPAINSMGIVNVEDCVFENNIALYNGGAIASFGPLTVNRTRFLDNRVTTSTDAMSNDYGGGAIMACGLLVVDNCVFTGNLAAYDYNGTENDSASGGAISVYENADDVSITNSNFTDNTAGLGGAIDIYDPQYQDEGVVLIDSNNFSKNCAYQGGAIALQHSATVTNNNFTQNRLNESVNQIPYGAAIELYDENEEKTYTLTSSGNTFKSNDAGNGFGGATDIGYGMIMNSSSNLYEDNKAAEGGAIYSIGNVTVFDDSFTDNSALYNGGAIASYGALTVNSSVFVSNNVTTTSNASLENYGGGAIMASGLLFVDDSVFIDNRAAYDDSLSDYDAALGGAIFVYDSTDDVGITNSRFTFNEAGYGGALTIYDPQYRDEGNVVLDSNNFNNNLAYEGGAVALQHSAIVTNNRFTENRLNENHNQFPFGAAIELYDENEEKTYTLTSSGNTFKSNDAGKGVGGAVDIGYGMILNSSSNLYEDNKAAEGGAIYSIGNVTVTDDVFNDNSAVYLGGAIYSKGLLTLNRTQFNNNTMTTSINARKNDYGGGAVFASGPLIVDNSVFTGNLAAYDDSDNEYDGASGGAIFVYNSTDDVSITNSNFTDNTAGFSGAVMVYDPQYRDEGNILIDSNNFIKNNVHIAGTIVLQHSAIVTNNNFTENRINTQNINNQPMGAAIVIYDEYLEKTYKLTLSHNTFKANDAGDVGNGGAILIAPGMILDSNSNVYENNKAVLGGAIYNLGNATVTDDVFCDNSAVYNGGAIYSGESLTVNRTRFIDNSVTTGTDAMINNYGGGAILASGLLAVDNCVLTGNLAAYDDNGSENDSAYGGAIFVFNSTDDVSITNSNFTANIAGSAGAVYVYDPQYRDEGVVHIDSNNFSKNMAYQGGAIALQHSAIVSNNYFTQNSLNNENDNILPFGAAIEFYNEKFEKTYTLTSSGNTFKANDAGNYGFGGAIDIGPGMLLNSSSNLYEDNKAAQGGVICSIGNVTVSDDDFSDNSALYVGGAIYSEGLLTVNRTRFIDNSVTTSTDAFSNDYGGGAIMAYGSLVVDNCVFTGNLAAYDDNGTDNDSASGGAIFVYNTTDDVSITNSNFTANRAGFGGAVDVYDPEYLDEGVVLIDSNIFNENMAYYGGAISLEHSAIVTNNYFTQNSLNNENANTIPFGAAIELYDENDEKTYTLTSSGNTFKSNDAGNYGFGGAIDIGPGMLLDSSSNLYEDNKAVQGGAIHSKGNVTLSSDTFTDNSALYNGGAIASYGSLTVNSSSFISNNMTTSYKACTENYGGGAIMASGPLFVDDSVFIDNRAAYDDSGSKEDASIGGAILVFDSTGDVVITNSRFTFNEAGLGGALMVYDPQYRDEGSVVIDSNNFNNNRAYQGGAVALQHSAIATNNRFIRNELNNENNDVLSMGGAIGLYDELNEQPYRLTLSDNTFTANDAGKTGTGGAVDLGKSVLLDSTSNLYENNTAYTAGAISNEGNVTLNDDTFTRNTASYAGAIANYGQTAVTNCTFNDNKAEERVDVFYTDNAVMINDSTFHTDNLERLVGTNNRPLISATNNTVNDEFLEERLINSTVTLKLATTDLILDNDNVITGTLIDATDVPIFNKTVDLYVNNVNTSSAVTDENGEFTFHYMPTGGGGADIQVKFMPNDHYLVTESEIVPVSFVNNDTNITPEPKPEPKPVPATKKAIRHTEKTLTKNNPAQTAKHTHTIRLASDNTLVWTGNSLTLEALNSIFDLNFTNGHLLVYIDGVLVFNDTVGDDLTTIIMELLDKYLGEHEIKVVFTDNKNNTNTYKENVIID